MSMRVPWGWLLPFVVSACSVAGTGPATTPIDVTPTLARFTIPLGRDAAGTWHWNDVITRNNEDEYVWQVRVVGTETFWFGYSLFKFPGRSAREGPLSALISEGQASVFHKEGRVARELPGVRPRLVVEGNGLVVELRDSAMIALLFAERPRSVAFETKALGRGRNSYSVPITYVGFLKP